MCGFDHQVVSRPHGIIISYLVIRFDYTNTKDFAAAQTEGFDLKISGGQVSVGFELSRTRRLNFCLAIRTLVAV